MKSGIIEIGGKTYELPKLDPEVYMDYLDLREEITETESKNRLFTKKQFNAMIDTIVKVYGDQFTAEDVKSRESGLSVGEIITAFVSIEIAVGGEVDDSMEKLRANFTKSK